RHAGNRETRRPWLLAEKTLDRGGGDVSLDDVAADLRRVAGGERLGYAEAGLQTVHRGGLDQLDRKSCLADVVDPGPAAAAVRVLGDRHAGQGLRRRLGDGGNGDGSRGKADEERPPADRHVEGHRLHLTVLRSPRARTASSRSLAPWA